MLYVAALLILIVRNALRTRSETRIVVSPGAVSVQSEGSQPRRFPATRFGRPLAKGGFLVIPQHCCPPLLIPLRVLGAGQREVLERLLGEPLPAQEPILPLDAGQPVLTFSMGRVSTWTLVQIRASEFGWKVLVAGVAIGLCAFALQDPLWTPNGLVVAAFLLAFPWLMAALSTIGERQDRSRELAVYRTGYLVLPDSWLPWSYFASAEQSKRGPVLRVAGRGRQHIHIWTSGLDPNECQTLWSTLRAGVTASGGI